MFSSADGGWFTVKTYKISNYPSPTTTTLSLYFANNDITSHSQKVKFAYYFNLSEVNVFDSENDIEIAAGCRMIRAYNGFVNSDSSACGVFWYLRGESVEGYLTTFIPEGLSGNVWSVCLENDGMLCFVSLKSDVLGGNIQSVAQWLATFEFVC